MDDTFVGEYQSLADGHLADAESDNKKVQLMSRVMLWWDFLKSIPNFSDSE